MNLKQLILLIVINLVFLNCEKKSSIEGMWVIKKVKMGDEEMTPNARWSKFNADFTQESGNGWFQHSIGTWNLNAETQELTIINTNGLTDPDGPFKISLDGHMMTWKRNEQGQDIEVFLERSDILPTTYGDELLGLWQLEEAVGNGPYFMQSDGQSTGSSIHFRWDKRFAIRSENGQINGVYNVHGHKPEVELIPYGSELNRDFWKIDFNENSITLNLLNVDSTITRQFKRIHEFPKD